METFVQNFPEWLKKENYKEKKRPVNFQNPLHNQYIPASASNKLIPCKPYIYQTPFNSQSHQLLPTLPFNSLDQPEESTSLSQEHNNST